MKKYKVPFVFYTREDNLFGKEIRKTQTRCEKNGDFVYRKAIVDFERNLAKFCGTKYAVSTGSCTGAMFISLKAVGIGQGDEVITVGHTYIATIDVIIAAGAKPILVDVQDDFNINPELIEKAITTKTKAILVVHLNGRMADMQPIMDIAKRHKLLVFEDAAQALGASYNGKMSGSFGLTGSFSFYPAKVLGSHGEGGALVTNSKKIADLCFLLRDHGEEPSYRSNGKKEIKCWGYNTIMDNKTAAILNVKMKYFPEWIKRRREIAIRYSVELLNVVRNPPYLPEEDVMQNYVIRIFERDALKKYLENHGIETLISWRTPNHRQPALKEIHGFNLPYTDKLSKEVLSLPIHPLMRASEVAYVIRRVREFFAK